MTDLQKKALEVLEHQWRGRYGLKWRSHVSMQQDGVMKIQLSVVGKWQTYLVSPEGRLLSKTIQLTELA